MKTLTTISRILVGVLFIISGLIKANDPLGFSYKLDEYFEVFHLGFFSVISVYASVFISVFEITLGIALLLGARIRLMVWLLLLLIVFFTFLTFYSAYYNKVTDCGCFGDALHLHPWQSFSKDIALLILILLIFFGKKQISPLLGERASSFFTVLGFAGSLGFAIYTYNHLPVVDFRPYKIGTNIREGMKGIPDQTQFYYTLKNIKTGEVKEFDHWPANWEAEWTYISNRTEVIAPGKTPAIHDFSIIDTDGKDKTNDILNIPGYHFILVTYDISKANRKVQPTINWFAEQCEKHHIPFIGLTSTPAFQTDVFRHDVQAMYPYCFCDGTALKTIIRSNPGLVLLQGSTVVDVWHYNDFPTFDEFSKKWLKN